MSKLERLRSAPGLLGSCRLAKLPSHPLLVLVREASSMDLEKV